MAPAIFHASINGQRKQIIVRLPKNDSSAVTNAQPGSHGADCSGKKIHNFQATPVDEDSPVSEMQVKAPSTIDTKLDAKEDKGRVSSGSAGEKPDTVSIFFRQTKPISNEQNACSNWLRESSSVEDMKTSTTGDNCADNGKESEKATKRDIRTDAEESLRAGVTRDIARGVKKEPMNANNPVSEPVFHAPKTNHSFTFRMSSPFDETSSAVKQPTANQDATPFFSFLKTASLPKYSAPILLPGADLYHLSSGTAQQRRELVVPSVKRFGSDPRTTSSSFATGQPDPPANSPVLDFHSAPPPLRDTQSAPPSEMKNLKLTPDPVQPNAGARCDAAQSDHIPEGKTVHSPLVGPTPVRPVERNRGQSAGAIRAEKQDSEQPNTSQLLDASVPRFGRYNSAPPKVSRSPLPSIRLQNLDVDDEPDSPLVHDFAVSSSLSTTAPNTPAPSAKVRAPSSKESDSFYGSSPEFEGESDIEGDLLALALSSPSPRQRSSSASSAMICSPPPGSLNVIWCWTLVDKKKKKSIASLIAQNLERRLGDTEIPHGYIYAFRAKDPQGKGYMKIGVTTDLGRRMRDHEKCYGECEQIYPPKRKYPYSPHARRVERLIHAELAEHARLLKKCPRNLQNHKSRHGEWFDINEQHTLAVIER